MLISHNKEPGIVPRARGGHADEVGWVMVGSLSRYQG